MALINIKFLKIASISINRFLSSQIKLLSISKMSAECVIELRSDTFTTPNNEMRKAMAEAIVGDDVYKEDPTVNELERQAADLLGKEAALFVPTGTMGNLIAVLVHCDRRGMEVILGDQSHIFLFEQGGVSQFGGIHSRTLTTKNDGTFDLDELRRKIRPNNMHNPVTGLICVENTHLRKGGQPLPMEFLDQLGLLKLELNLPLHLDGARIMNAAVYHKVSPSTVARHFDSVCFCLSKGLGSPVGSILVGTNQFIAKAIRVRKALGGGMRQAGFLAAAGIYSINNMIERLEDDHKHARQIARAIVDMKSDVISACFDDVRTNIIMAKVNEKFVTGDEFTKRLGKVLLEEEKTLGKSIVVKVNEIEKATIRFVTHANVNQNEILLAIQKLKYVIEEFEKKA